MLHCNGRRFVRPASIHSVPSPTIMPLEVSTMEIVAAVLFTLAVIHTFSTKFFAHLAHLQPNHAGLWHLLAEVEVVFGFWAFVLVATMLVMLGAEAAVGYMDGRDYTEPMFVFVIMVIAASRPILQTVLAAVRALARLMPLPRGAAVYFLCLSAVPLLGSFITEPAAMTLAAMMLRDAYFSRRLSTRLQYSTIGVLFVNVSIGGTLTHFAAPPVLMVAAKWQWDTAYMFAHFGWKAATAVLINAAIVTWLFRSELMQKAHVAKARAVVPECRPSSPAFISAFWLLSCWPRIIRWCSWACFCSSSAIPRPISATRIV